MRRTDSVVTTLIPVTFITFDESGEINRWNQIKHDPLEAINLITEYSEIKCTEQNYILQESNNSFFFIDKKNNKLFNIKVIIDDKTIQS